MSRRRKSPARSFINLPLETLSRSCHLQLRSLVPRPIASEMGVTLPMLKACSFAAASVTALAHHVAIALMLTVRINVLYACSPVTPHIKHIYAQKPDRVLAMTSQLVEKAGSTVSRRRAAKVEKAAKAVVKAAHGGAGEAIMQTHPKRHIVTAL